MMMEHRNDEVPVALLGAGLLLLCVTAVTALLLLGPHVPAPATPPVKRTYLPMTDELIHRPDLGSGVLPPDGEIEPRKHQNKHHWLDAQ